MKAVKRSADFFLFLETWNVTGTDGHEWDLQAVQLKYKNIWSLCYRGMSGFGSRWCPP